MGILLAFSDADGLGLAEQVLAVGYTYVSEAVNPTPVAVGSADFKGLLAPALAICPFPATFLVQAFALLVGVVVLGGRRCPVGFSLRRLVGYAIGRGFVFWFIAVLRAQPFPDFNDMG